MGLKDLLDIEEIVVRANKAAVTIAARLPEFASLTTAEIERIHQRLMEIAENEYVFYALWSNRSIIYDAVRVVKAKRGKGEFMGAEAEGDNLDLLILRPADIKKTGTALTNWVFTATAGTDYFESATGDARLELPDYEARVYCGWADPVDSPKLECVLYELPTRNEPHPTPCELNSEYPVIVHKGVLIKPETAYRIQVRYHTNGTDMARPIGVRTVPAEKFTF